MFVYKILRKFGLLNIIYTHYSLYNRYPILKKNNRRPLLNDIYFYQKAVYCVIIIIIIMITIKIKKNSNTFTVYYKHRILNAY